MICRSRKMVKPEPSFFKHPLFLQCAGPVTLLISMRPALGLILQLGVFPLSLTTKMPFKKLRSEFNPSSFSSFCSSFLLEDLMTKFLL